MHSERRAHLVDVYVEFWVLVPPQGSSLGTKGRESELAKREADLAAREAELKRWEADLRSSGRLEAVKNWPKCCPVANMDIKGEVPEGLQNVVTCAYWSYLVSFGTPPFPYLVNMILGPYGLFDTCFM